MKPPKILDSQPSSNLIEEVDSVAKPSRCISFEHEISKTHKVPISILRIWLNRYVGDQVTIEEDSSQKLYIIHSEDVLVLARASILMEQVEDRGFPKRPFWTCQRSY